MTQQELEAHVDRPLDDIEIKHMRFLVTAKTRDGNVLVAMAFCECEKEQLYTPIPKSASIDVYGENEDGEPHKAGLILRDFALNTIELDTTAIFSCSARFRDVSRSRITTAKDLDDWIGFIQPFGQTADDLLTVKERDAKIQVGEAL